MNYIGSLLVLVFIWGRGQLLYLDIMEAGYAGGAAVYFSTIYQSQAYDSPGSGICYYMCVCELFEEGEIKNMGAYRLCLRDYSS